MNTLKNLLAKKLVVKDEEESEEEIELKLDDENV